jgi:CubicO group peptidase (beta-lactamase class C family)
LFSDGSLSGKRTRGKARDGFVRADRLMRQAVAGRDFHDAVLLLAAGGQVVLHRAYGAARLDSVFDLASLTKPLATTTVLIRLCAAGKIGPMTRVADVMPEAEATPLAQLRLWHLLSHSSGLPAWQPYYKHLGQLPASRARRALWRQLVAEALDQKPGTCSLYSDLGFMLLGRLIERLEGRRLDRVARRQVFNPLGLTRIGFPPHQDCSEWDFIPTEALPASGRLLGRVHDDNCRSVGGICGHAGLFGSAFDIYLIARELAQAYHGRRSLFSRAVVRRFFSFDRVPGSSWALGWDTPRAVERPSCGSRFSQRSVGHLGFTGTSLWLDLEREVIAILLTNRVYYGREPNPMKRFRPLLHDAMMAALGVR